MTNDERKELTEIDILTKDLISRIIMLVTTNIELNALCDALRAENSVLEAKNYVLKKKQ